jgi:hypothetical protein
MTNWRELCAELVEANKTADWEECDDVWGRAEAALSQPEPGGVTDRELGAFFVEKGLLYATESTYALASVTRNVHGQVLARAFREALTRYAHPTIEPVPVAERPWEREKGWRDPDGECWWCPPDGPLYWQMANPAMVYGGWLLPAHALPLPTPTP